MSSAANPLQAAIFAALSGDATLTAMLANGSASVFDRVQESAAFPYVVIGEDELHDWSTFGTLGETGTVTVHVWSQAEGKKECKAILDRIDTLLNRQTLALASGYVMVGLLRDLQHTMPDADGLSYHGIARFKVWVMQ